MIAALIVAAGRGTRARLDDDAPKQYVALAGRPILALTLSAFRADPRIEMIQVVIHPDDTELYANCIPASWDNLCPPVYGGETRQASVRAGLDALCPHHPEIVLIHDAARPLVDGKTISAVIDAILDDVDGAIAAVPVSDTIKRAQHDTAIIDKTIDRRHMWRALTPQAFRFDKIHAAHRAAASRDIDFTDDASVAEAAGLTVQLIEGDPKNIKITTPGDFSLAQAYLNQAHPNVRTGQGFDVHRFADGDHVCLCGIDIPHAQRLDGHSDADVAMHALTDAILGAIGDGDIGQHFPPSDQRWRGAASQIFLQDAVRRTHERGGRIANVDITIICQTPKIGPHRDAMRARLAEIMELEIDRIGVKATTSEGLGFTGRGEGIAAIAIATVMF